MKVILGNKMTREEQIRQAGIEYTIGTRPMCIGGGAFSELIDEKNRCKPFEEGAKWADKTIIKQACEWWTEWFDTHNPYNMGDCINDFKKARGNNIWNGPIKILQSELSPTVIFIFRTKVKATAQAL